MLNCRVEFRINRLDFWQEAKETGGQTVSITGAIIVVDVWYALFLYDI